MDKICRICCQINSVLPLFSCGNDNSLAHKLTACASVNVCKDELLPLRICEPCARNLESAYSFKMKCERSEQFLRSLLSNDETDFGLLTAETISEQYFFFVNKLFIKTEQEHGSDLYAKDTENGILVDSKLNVQKNKSPVDRPIVKSENSEDNVNSSEMCSSEIDDNKDSSEDLRLDFCENSNTVDDAVKPKNRTKRVKSESVPEKNECDICGKVLNSKRTLIGHKRIHSGEKPYKCSVCSKLFTHRTALTFHIKRHTGEKYQCQECGKDYTRKSTLTQHIKLIHSNKIIDQNGVVQSVHVKAFGCDVCDKKFATTQHLNSHVRIHTGERNYVCDLCGKQFTHSSTLSAHHRVKHKGEKKYVCDICGKRFPHMCGLKCHYKAHSGVKDVGCSQCGQFFASKSQLKDHEKRAHLLKKDYQCSECGKPFVTNKELKRHIFSFHQKERPFVCKFCNRKFSFVGNLNYHVKKRHNTSN